MADLFNPVTHVDGENYDAADVNRLERGIDALDTELDAQTDRIDALYASGGAGGDASQVPSGSSSVRATVSPSVGRLFFDTELIPPRLLVGTGSTWVNADGSAPTGTGGGGSVPGTGTSPQNMTASVVAGGTIGQIDLSWSAVPGASFYTLYEIESPNGVSGATALTGTTTSRTPGTARNYDYWVTATTNGVESAASNHVTPSLPYVAPGGGGGGGGGTASNPSTLLNINGLGSAAGGWWNLGVGKPTGHVDVAPDALKTYVESPYYTLNAAGTHVVFRAPMNGGRTSANTKYPRCELREYATGSTSTKAAWSGTSGNHFMSYRAKMIHFAPIKQECCIGQIHDGSDDRLQIRAEGTNWVLKVNGDEVRQTIATGIPLGTEVFVEIRVNSGLLTVRFNGSQKYSANPGYTSSGNYFKLGCYAQANSTDQANSSSEYHSCEVRDIVVTHS